MQVGHACLACSEIPAPSTGSLANRSYAADNVCQARVMAYASQLRVVYRARLSIGHDSGARPAREHETSNTRPKISYSLEQCFASRVP